MPLEHIVQDTKEGARHVAFCCASELRVDHDGFARDDASRSR